MQLAAVQPTAADGVCRDMHGRLKILRALFFVLHQLAHLAADAVTAGLCAEAAVMHSVTVKRLAAAEMAHRKKRVDTHPVIVVLHPHLRRVVAQQPPDPTPIKKAGTDKIVLHHIQVPGVAGQTHIAAGRARTVEGAPVGVFEGLALLIYGAVVGVYHAEVGGATQFGH